MSEEQIDALMYHITVEVIYSMKAHECEHHQGSMQELSDFERKVFQSREDLKITLSARG